jgi:hypothetical protein
VPLFPKPVNGFTLLSFDPFFTGVFFIFVLSLDLDLPAWASYLVEAVHVPNRGALASDHESFKTRDLSASPLS